MTYLVHMVDEVVDAPKRENIQKRQGIEDAIKLSQLMVRERLRSGYAHADFIDQWTILKNGSNVFRIRIEDSRERTPSINTSEPLLWTPHSVGVH